MLAVGALSLKATGGLAIFALGSLLICGSSLFYAGRALWRGEVNIGLLIISQLMLWYLVPWIYAPLVPTSFGDGGGSADDLALTSLIVVLVSLVSACIFFVWRPLVRLDLDLPTASEMTLSRCVVALSAIQFVLLVRGDWGYATVTGVEGGETLADWVVFMRSITVVQPVLIAIVMGRLGHRGPGARLFWVKFALLASCALLQLGWFAVMGRRTVLIAAFLSAVVFLRCRYPEGVPRRAWVGVMLRSSLFLSIILFLLFAYYGLRQATDALGPFENLTLANFLIERGELFWGGVGYLDNTVSRPFSLVQSLWTLRDQATGFLYGWNIASQAMLAVPSIIFPGKLELIGPTLEELWGVALNVTVTDYSNTLVTESYVDFGWLGLPIHLTIVIALFMISLTVVSRSVGQLGRLFASILVVSSMMTVEQTMVFYFCVLRDGFLALLALSLVSWLLGAHRLRF